MGVTRYVVRCMHWTPRRSICGTVYACTKKAYWAQLNACPECRSFKAQYMRPERKTKKEEERDGE